MTRRQPIRLSKHHRHWIRRLSEQTGICQFRIGLAARRAPLQDIVRHVLSRQYPQGVSND